MTKWYWHVECYCGYNSRWTKYKWIAWLTSFWHMLTSGHPRGAMTLSAWDHKNS